MLFSTVWLIQRDIPVLRAKLTLKPYQGQYKGYFTYFNLPPGKTPVKVHDRFDLELTNVPVHEEEKYAPPEGALKSRVTFYYTAGEVKAEEFWKAQTAQWSKTVEGFIGKPDAVRATVQALTGNTPMETLLKVYAKAQTFRNLSFEEEPTETAKRNAAEVVNKSEGYRDEINRAFVAMARAAGLEANVVRVAARDEDFFSPEIPDADQMSGEMAVVTMDGKPVYLDPGTPTAPFGIVSWEKSATAAYALGRRGEPSQFVTVERQAAEKAVLRRVADLRLNGELLEGTVAVTFSGQEALVRRLRSWSDDEAARTKTIEDEVKGWFPDGASVKLTQLTGAKSHAEPLVAKFDVTLHNLISSAGSRTLLPLSVFASSAKNPFAPATRRHAVYFAYPSREEDEVKLTLSPGAVPAAIPPPARISAGSVAYTNETKQDGNVLTYKRAMSVDTMLVEPKYYNTLRSFYSQVVAADQKPLVLVEKRQ